MGIVLDIVVLAILALSIFMGYKKGLISVVFNLCALIIAVVATWILYTPVTNLIINNTTLDENIKEMIIEKGVVEQKDSSENGDANKYIQEYISKTINDTKNNVVKSAADIVAEKIVAIIVVISLFIIIRLLLIILKFVANGIAELPLVKQCNEFGGVLYGILRGFFVIYLIFAICFLIMSINNIEFISNLIDSSILSKIIYSHNLILNIIF